MPRKQRPARRRAAQQIDLFAAGTPTTIEAMPVWFGLPSEAQAALTNLMKRLFLEHATKRRIGSAMGDSHDL